MPNFCENDVLITGSKEDITALHEWAGDKFEFSNILPIPVIKKLATEILDWCTVNWGTKWDAHEMQNDWGDTFVNLFFLTAWAPPKGIYKTIVKKFPNLKIVWDYDEPGEGIHGSF